jgi:hypothetical protein
MMTCVDRGCAESRSSERQTAQIEDVMHTVAKTMVSIPPTIRENISLGLLSMMSIVPSPAVFSKSIILSTTAHAGVSSHKSGCVS